MIFGTDSGGEIRVHCTRNQNGKEVILTETILTRPPSEGLVRVGQTQKKERLFKKNSLTIDNQ